MDGFGNPTSGRNTLLIFAFLHQTDCGNTEYRKELLSLGRELQVSLDINSNGSFVDTQEETGRLESDGHQPSFIRGSFHDIHPTVELEGPVNREEAVAIQEVAAELREIAALLEHDAVVRATQNLGRELLDSPLHKWKDHLIQQVESLVRQGVVLEHLPQERVIVALTLTLVKGVCEQAPRLLRNVFNMALHYISSVMTM